MDKSAVSASELKAHCSEVIDSVEKGRRTILVTRRGRPVALIVPAQEQETTLFGFARGTILVQGDILEPLDVTWEAQR